jgi:hypothetical protein
MVQTEPQCRSRASHRKEQIQEALDGKNVEWMEKVSDAQYLAGPTEQRS